MTGWNEANVVDVVNLDVDDVDGLDVEVDGVDVVNVGVDDVNLVNLRINLVNVAVNAVVNVVQHADVRYIGFGSSTAGSRQGEQQ